MTLRFVWAVMAGPASKSMAAFLSEIGEKLLPSIRASKASLDGNLRVADEPLREDSLATESLIIG